MGSRLQGAPCPSPGLSSPSAGHFSDLQLRFPAEKHPQSCLWFLLRHGRRGCLPFLSLPSPPHCTFHPREKILVRMTNINSAQVTKTTFPAHSWLAERKETLEGRHHPLPAASQPPSSTGSYQQRPKLWPGDRRAPLRGAVRFRAAAFN